MSDFFTQDFLPNINRRHFKTIDSTNTALINGVAMGELSHIVHHLYTTDHQSAGRGQHGRRWESGADNVMLSLYVPMGVGDFELQKLSGLLSLAVGFEIANLQIIQDINKTRKINHLPPIGVKWANDVGFFDEKLNIFKKLAGILIEPVFKKQNDKNTLVGIVIGIGLNVNHSPVIKDGLYQATCLNELADIQLSAKELYQDITIALLKAVQICNACQDNMMLNEFIQNFNHRHLLQHQFIHIFIQNNMTDIHAQGICIGIGKDGELLLQDNHHITPIYAGMAKIIHQ